MKKSIKKEPCPIGSKCSKSDRFKGCPTYEKCLNETMSWAIPYTLYEDSLVVNGFPCRYSWRKECSGISHKLPPQCSVPSGSFQQISEPRWETEEYVYIILDAWKKAGWEKAVSIDSAKKEETAKLNYAEDGIPF